MKLWPWKKRPEPATDVGEARRLRAEAKDEYRDAILTGNVVAQVTSYIAERRALNHFGDSLQISLKRRSADG